MGLITVKSAIFGCLAITAIVGITAQSRPPQALSDFRSAFYWDGLVDSANHFCETLGESKHLGKLKAEKVDVSLVEMNKYNVTCNAQVGGKPLSASFTSSADPGNASGMSGTEAQLTKAACKSGTTNGKVVQVDSTESTLHITCSSEENRSARTWHVDYARVTNSN